MCLTTCFKAGHDTGHTIDQGLDQTLADPKTSILYPEVTILLECSTAEELTSLVMLLSAGPVEALLQPNCT